MILMKDTDNTVEIAACYQKAAKKIQQDFISTMGEHEQMVLFLESMEREEDWRTTRAYLTILDEHYADFSLKQNEIILQYLYELLLHDSGSIRIQAARTAGHILSLFVEENVKIWTDFLHKLLFMGKNRSEQKRSWITYALKVILLSLLDCLDKTKSQVVMNTYVAYFKSNRWDRGICFNLISGILNIDYSEWSVMQRGYIVGFLRSFLTKDDEDIRIVSLFLIKKWLDQGWNVPADVKEYLIKTCRHNHHTRVSERYLGSLILEHFGEAMDLYQPMGEKEFDEILRENFKVEDSWFHKVVNFDVLKQEYATSTKKRMAQYASHLQNILRLNSQPSVFLQAGEDLVAIMPKLEEDQKSEIMQDMFKAIELRDDTSNYVPSFLGRTFLYLDDVHQRELLDQFNTLVDSKNADTVKMLLESIAIIFSRILMPESGLQLKKLLISQEAEASQAPQISHMSQTSHMSEVNLEKIRFFSGILYKGMANYRADVASETLFLTGKYIYTQNDRMGEQQTQILLSMAKRILMYMDMYENKTFHFKYYRMIPLGNIASTLERIPLQNTKASKRKIAFFSGSFDPFSTGQKAVVKEICDMGFDVYLDAHEFSWNKNTQPLLIRRQIMAMACANLEHAYIFPESIPVNVGNPLDLKRLKEYFKGREVYIVAGSDVVGDSEEYNTPPQEDSIHHFPHIIFSRNEIYGYVDEEIGRNILTSEIIYLKLPAYYDKMTSNEIRRNVEEGKDISHLVDVSVQNMIKEWNLYADQPQYKKNVKTKPIRSSHEKKENGTYATRVINRQEVSLHGEVIWHEITLKELYKVCDSKKEICILRKTLSGKCIVIDEISGALESLEDYREIALNEMLAFAQEQEYSFVLYFGHQKDAVYLSTLLKSQGFIAICKEEPFCENTADTEASHGWILDVRTPIALFMDAGSFLKDTYAQEPSMMRTIVSCRNKLKDTLCQLFPGNLVLDFDSEILNYKMTHLIQQYNRKDMSQTDLPQTDLPQADMLGIDQGEESFDMTSEYGSNMCVPFGKVLRGAKVPDVITKELNTEKMYDSDLKHFRICELPDYAALDNQIKVIKSFARPVILVDDLYHKGYRMDKIDELLQKEDVAVSHVIVGVKSGRGCDLAMEKKKSVESVYTIPNMRFWLIESDMYPFLGGDGIHIAEDKSSHRSALPSINPVLPYEISGFLKGLSPSALYHLSKRCLENTKEFYTTLESIYQKKNHKTLTLGRIGEVITEPRYPESAILWEAETNQTVSALLAREIMKLRRLKHLKDL